MSEIVVCLCHVHKPLSNWARADDAENEMQGEQQKDENQAAHGQPGATINQESVAAKKVVEGAGQNRAQQCKWKGKDVTTLRDLEASRRTQMANKDASKKGAQKKNSAEKDGAKKDGATTRAP